MWYVVGPGGEIAYTCETEEEAIDIINNDDTGELEIYPEEARIRE